MSAEVQKQGMIPNLQHEIVRPIQKPSPIVLPPSPSTTLGKRTADELEGDCQEDTSQAGAGDDGDYFSDISSVDFCVCQPPLSAQKPPRPRNCKPDLVINDNDLQLGGLWPRWRKH